METFFTPDLKSVVSGVTWPALPSNAGAQMLALQFQLEQSQWLPAEVLLARQLEQLQLLLSHAEQSVPYYQQRLKAAGVVGDGAPLTMEKWARLPLLTREDVQAAGDSLLSGKVPVEHGKLTRVQTSGSTGQPVVAYKTGVAQFFWGVITLRDHLWHRRDLGAKFVAIRPESELKPGKGVESRGWGPAAISVAQPGPAAMMNVRSDIAVQAEWLKEQQPVYLLSLPSNILALARYFSDRGEVLPSLREVLTYGELLSPEVRQACRLTWGVTVKDMYSSQEVGYIALQCPDYEHYHVQAEGALVEVLNESGAACCAGETGQVVVTPLHNFGMPFIRYVVGDYAEVGDICPCGRGLPVLKRVFGRQRNMLVLADGRTHWPSFPAELWTAIAPIRQLQLEQTDFENLTAHLVCPRPLTLTEQEAFAGMLRDRFGYPFVVTFQYHQQIARSKGGKYEDFVSRVAGQSG